MAKALAAAAVAVGQKSFRVAMEGVTLVQAAPAGAAVVAVAAVTLKQNWNSSSALKMMTLVVQSGNEVRAVGRGYHLTAWQDFL
jgi:hypothetical protein